jgi:hypothetical protein
VSAFACSTSGTTITAPSNRIAETIASVATVLLVVVLEELFILKYTNNNGYLRKKSLQIGKNLLNDNTCGNLHFVLKKRGEIFEF